MTTDITMPESIVIDGETYRYFSAMHECTPGNLHVYQTYQEEEAPIVLLTPQEALDIAGGKPYVNPQYKWADKQFNLNELRINHTNQEWCKEHLKHAQLAVSTTVPYSLLINGKMYSLEPEDFSPFENTHCYSLHSKDVILHRLWLSEEQVLAHLQGMTEEIDMSRQLEAKRKNGYECSSSGDKRFSAFNAWMPDGRTIEHWYQCGTLDGRGKGYDPGGNNWRLGKGKIPLHDRSKEVQWQEYYGFWDEWAKFHPVWMKELHFHAMRFDYVLSDRFAATPVNQARALAQWINNNLL